MRENFERIVCWRLIEIELIFDSMLFDGISPISPHVFVFGFVYFFQHAPSFTIHFISGHTNVLPSYLHLTISIEDSPILVPSLLSDEYSLSIHFSSLRWDVSIGILQLYCFVFILSSSLYFERKLSDCHTGYYSN